MQTAKHLKDFDFNYLRVRIRSIDKELQLGAEGRLDAIVKTVEENSEYKRSPFRKLKDYRICEKDSNSLYVVIIYDGQGKLPSMDYIDFYRVD